jgi:hypothetical protein
MKVNGAFRGILELLKFERFDTFVVCKLREGWMSRLVRPHIKIVQ